MNRTLLRLGFILVLLALLTGLVLPRLANARLGLAAHTVGLLGGLFLVVLGMVMPAFALAPRTSALLQWCWVYAAYANWFASVLGAVTGASRLTPLAGAATTGGPLAESVVAFLLKSLALAAIVGATLAVWGLRNVKDTDAIGLRPPAAPARADGTRPAEPLKP